MKTGIVGRDIENNDCYENGDIGYAIRYDDSDEICHVGQDELFIYEVLPSDLPPQTLNPQRTFICKVCSTSRSERMNKCDQCKNVYYCSRACQKKDWKEGGHKELCKHIQGVKSMTKAFNRMTECSHSLDKDELTAVADWNVRLNKAKEQERRLEPPGSISSSIAPMKYFLENKDSLRVTRLLEAIGAKEQVAAARGGFPGAMPLINRLMRKGMCTDENLAILFGSAESVRSLVIENEAYC